MKATRYTKKQITEAIAFWQRILENKSKLLDSLVADFDYGAVFNNVPTQINTKLFVRLFDKINKYVFDSKLRKWPFIVDDKKCIAMNALCGYVNSLISNVEKHRYDVVLKTIKIGSDTYSSPFYALSNKLMNSMDCSLPLVTSLLAHEMIHQWNYENGNDGHIHWLDKAYGREYNPHGPTFEKLMNKINAEHGLHITKCGFGTIADINVDANIALSKFAGNDYKNESTGNKIHGHRIIKHTSDWSAIMQFV